jgi:hypothetical protein
MLYPWPDANPNRSPCPPPARRVRLCRGRKAAGLAVLRPVVDVAALAQVMVEAQLLPEADRNNRVKITAALQKAISIWHGA